MDLEIGNKVAVVFAASKGLGKAAAIALAGEGCKVAICSRTVVTSTGWVVLGKQAGIR